MYTIAAFLKQLSNYLRDLSAKIRNGDRRAALEGYLFIATLVATAIYILWKIGQMLSAAW